MPKTQGFSYLLVLVDTLIGWTDAFLTKTRATEVSKALPKETVARFGLPQLLQSNNRSRFTATISQKVATSLRIKYGLHSFWHPQASGKVERTNQTLKSALAKL